jgi:2,5-diketo-D-gluconate reductase A
MGTDHVDAYLTHDTVVSTEVWSPIQEAKRHELALSLGTSWDPIGPSHDLNRVWPGMEITQLRLGPCGSDIGQRSVQELLRSGVVLVGIEAGMVCGKDPVVMELATRRDVSPYQVLARWAWQMGIPLIIGTKRFDHLIANLDINGFTLSHFEMAMLESAIHFHQPTANPAPGTGISDPLALVAADIWRVQ